MATQNAPGILQVELKMLQGNTNMSNIFHVDNGGGVVWTRTNMDSIAGVFQTWFQNSASAQMSSSVTLIDKVLTDLTSLAGLRVVYGEETPPAGQLTSPALPPNVTFATRLNIALRGRGTSGRIFWPGLTEEQITFDTLSKTTADLIVSAMDNLIAAIPAAVPGAALVVLSRYSAGVKRPNGVGIPVVSASYSDLTLDSQKDRLPNHRRKRRSS